MPAKLTDQELLTSNSGNFLVCPLSAELILGLVLQGAGGKTSSELSAALHLPSDSNKLQQTFKAIIPHLDGGDKYTLNSANRIYIKDGYEIQNDFKNIAVNDFKADIQNINFAKNEQAAQEMNKWVEDKTHNKIKDLIDKDDLDEDTRTVLINAMYFHGKWVHEFPEHGTIKNAFYSNAGEIEVDMMQQLNDLKYYESSDLKAKFLELPYEGNDVTMTIVLPNDKDGLSHLEAHMADVLASPQYQKPLVQVKIPKFQMGSSIEFKPILQKLNVIEAFEDRAEFLKIVVGEPLKISKVIQKTFIEVEEHGTIASAATAVEMGVPFSSNYVPPRIVMFQADHPFVYYIKVKDIVFFVGRYTGA